MASRGIAPLSVSTPVAGARPEGNAVGDRRGLQWSQRARFLTVGFGLGQIVLAHAFHQHAPAREHPHQPANEGLQQRVQLVVGGRTHLDKDRRAIGAAPVQKLCNARHKDGPAPIDEACTCHTCASDFSRGYLHHLDRCGKMLGPMRASIHNLHYSLNLMRELREAIEQQRFAAFARQFAADRARGV